MQRQIYVNLPVRDLDRSKRFFTHLGFGFEPKFTDEKAACMIVSDSIYVMLLTEPFFRTFTKKAVCDTTRSTEVLVCLSCGSRNEVDELVGKAAAQGGTMPREPKDHGFMYEHAFEDPDGHTWELMYMDPNAKAPA